MKNYNILLFLIILFNNSIAYSESKYIDIDFILNNSIVGKSLNDELGSLEKNKKSIFQEKEKMFLNEERQILSKKKLLNEDKFNKEILALRKKVDTYNKEKKNFFDELNKKKVNYTKIILKELNVIISEYVKKNDISIVLSKKNIVVAKKNLDITNDILLLIDEKMKKIDFEW